jgi:glycosyltransferase involved in cell wall biosynthesis
MDLRVYSWPRMRDLGHILILVENLSVPFDRRVWHECTTLVAAGYCVSVICPRGRSHDQETYAEIDGVRVFRYPIPPEAESLAGYVREYPYMLWWTMRLAWRLWRRGGFDVIHACNPPDLFFLVGWVFRPYGVSFVYDQHDANPEILLVKRGDDVNAGLAEIVVRWAERRTYRLADVVIAPNDSYRELALTRGGKRPADVFVVRSAPRKAEFAGHAAMPFDRNGHRFLIGYLGVMGKQDGVEFLVEAVAELVDEGYDILLYLAGDGERFDDIRTLVRNRGLEARVRMPGFQTKEEFMPALSEADVCVAPDPPGPFNDISTMNKIVEYMALGRASVAFGLRENRVSGGDAVVYSGEPTAHGIAQAIKGLLDDRQARERLGHAARERFETALVWERSAPELLRAYAHLRDMVRTTRAERSSP